MQRMRWHRKHGHDAIVVEDVQIPVALLPAARVDSSDPAIDAVHRHFIGREADNGAQLLVGGVDEGSLFVLATVDEDPCPRYWGRPVGVGDLGERGEEGWIDDELKNR